MCASRLAILAHDVDGGGTGAARPRAAREQDVSRLVVLAHSAGIVLVARRMAARPLSALRLAPFVFLSGPVDVGLGAA